MRRKQSTYTEKFNPENPGIGLTQSRDFRIRKMPGIPGFRDPGINSLDRSELVHSVWSRILVPWNEVHVLEIRRVHSWCKNSKLHREVFELITISKPFLTVRYVFACLVSETNLLKKTLFRQSKEKPSLYVGFQLMSPFLEMRRLILLQKMAFLSLLLY